ncbi:MAG TPA: phytanoyl-CoA dioxygenase family protein [Rhodopila sp.]|uniref:phytanoyl-CoA dioxygenase family protein n=1 Tax=Rhodopila sp. TaxID=2480087 RepID=UPI002D153F6B|nr:phytanoyl-CoA dioxygenase family protein [Rhodopila sp.]HVY15443.1 phytanoyl-CoA dioxygenase family protein [Rhodopila sp.]
MWAQAGDDCGMKTLWTDRPDALDHLEALYKARRVRKAERDELAHYIEHGWIIWRQAIEPALIDRFAHDIRFHHEHPGMFMTTNHRSGQSRMKRSGSEPEHFESLFDLYVNLPSAREVCLHKRISRFLSLVFEAKPVAMQQLLFQRSNGHQVHQDTSVVTVEDPLLLAASWIALEDVREGSGELAFYDRSHRLPHYLFSDKTKRLNFAVDDQQAYAAELEDACRRQGFDYQRFMAKKGDVLIWAADLVHRSHPRSMAEDTSRLSCVTHYHPATTEPFWFRFHPDRRTIRPFRDRGAYVSCHYPLERAGKGMMAPESGLIDG